MSGRANGSQQLTAPRGWRPSEISRLRSFLSIRFTDERHDHLLESHPEMRGQLDRLAKTLREPEIVVRSRTDQDVELFYRSYPETPVTQKFLCAVVKSRETDSFLITAYFTDSVKQGDVLWEKP